MADRDKARLLKVLETLRETQARTYALTEELLALLNGGPGIGDKLKQLEAAFERFWQGRYPNGKYLWQYVKDRPLAKQLLAAMDVEELERRAALYVRDDDPYLVRARHPFALFRSNVNRYAGDSGLLELAADAPVDCKHHPPCHTDQEHTRKRVTEMRA